MRSRVRPARPTWLRLALPCFALAIGLVPLHAAPAWARVQHTTGYSKAQTFNGALRFIRVDHGYKITEKDSENGYLLFEYTSSSSAPSVGSVEVIEQEDGVVLIVQLPKMPEHHERYLAEGLMAKLRSEYGEPPQKRAPKKDDDKKPKDDDSQGDGERKPDDSAPPSADAADPQKPGSGERVRGYRVK